VPLPCPSSRQVRQVVSTAAGRPAPDEDTTAGRRDVGSFAANKGQKGGQKLCGPRADTRQAAVEGSQDQR